MFTFFKTYTAKFLSDPSAFDDIDLESIETDDCSAGEEVDLLSRFNLPETSKQCKHIQEIKAIRRPSDVQQMTDIAHQLCELLMEQHKFDDQEDLVLSIDESVEVYNDFVKFEGIASCDELVQLQLQMEKLAQEDVKIDSNNNPNESMLPFDDGYDPTHSPILFDSQTLDDDVIDKENLSGNRIIESPERASVPVSTPDSKSKRKLYDPIVYDQAPEFKSKKARLSEQSSSTADSLVNVVPANSNASIAINKVPVKNAKKFKMKIKAVC